MKSPRFAPLVRCAALRAVCGGAGCNTIPRPIRSKRPTGCPRRSAASLSIFVSTALTTVCGKARGRSPR